MPDGTAPLNKSDILAQVDVGWRELREGIRHLGRGGMRERTPTGWTYKDLIAHLAAWEEEAARRLRALATGGAVPVFGSDAEIDAFNARAVEERSLVGAEAIVDELEAAHRQLVKVVADLSEEIVADTRAQRWIGGNTFGHYAEHRDELRAFTSR